MAVGHNRRFWPAIAALRGMIAEGALGQLLHIEGITATSTPMR
jgi:predicted dehydrogenase